MDFDYLNYWYNEYKGTFHVICCPLERGIRDNLWERAFIKLDSYYTNLNTFMFQILQGKIPPKIRLSQWTCVEIGFNLRTFAARYVIKGCDFVSSLLGCRVEEA